MSEAYLNPTTKDYVLREGKDLIVSDDLHNETFKRIVQTKGESVLEPEVGRRKRPRAKDTPETRRLIVRDCQEALEPMVLAGRAERVEVWEDTTKGYKPGLMYIHADAFQAGGRKASFEAWIAVG